MFRCESFLGALIDDVVSEPLRVHSRFPKNYVAWDLLINADHFGKIGAERLERPTTTFTVFTDRYRFPARFD
jgi:hypothetical protein